MRWSWFVLPSVLLACGTPEPTGPLPYAMPKGGPAAAASGQPPERSVVRQATLRFRSRTPRKLADDAAQIAVAARGVVVQAEVRSVDGAVGAIEVQLRLSPAVLDATLRDLRRLGGVVDETSSGQDVTQEVGDLASRSNAQRSQEMRMLALLERPVLLRDPVQLEQEISRVRDEIAQTQVRIRDLQDRSGMASVRLIARAEDEPAARSLPVSVQLNHAFARALQHATTMISWLLLAAGYAAPLALLALVARAVRRRTATRRPEPAVAPRTLARASRRSGIAP